ncbi:unnamed protein product [Eruca vesicaria subsp. sativa]|uniref:GRF-type domain-containing protein n=1 Tax=Eruca vesicaria subsp. sativa TaxID=29727 RepID=A0ABC8J4Q8_ERUVS|nr:unnamed protein product [Eruca vesicaria subsp. sativa]
MMNLSKSSSSSQIANSSCRNRVAERSRGIPRHCRCGERVVLRTSCTVKNPGRLFYCSPLSAEGDKYHLFSWTDERIVEEVEDMMMF